MLHACVSYEDEYYQSSPKMIKKISKHLYKYS